VLSELRFDGRVAVVTGAGRGIGRAHALLLAQRGARVVVNDLGGAMDGTGADATPAAQVVAEITRAGGQAVANADDVSTTEGAEAIVASALDAFGRVDAVVNNAGILTTSEFPQTEVDELMRHLSVHLLGSFNVTRAAWPHMVEQGYGRVVATTSASFFGMTTIVAYASAKAALIGLVRSLALIGAPHGIASNLIAPLADTRMSGGSRLPGATPRPRRPDDAPRPAELIAPVVAYLCHEDCPVSGEILSAGRGGVARIFLAETVGYTNLGLTPEDVRDNWSAVVDEEGASASPDFSSYSAAFRANRAAQTAALDTSEEATVRSGNQTNVR
jgi:NAD(P)-dependent dehydrogenase (short-subunit alcohol dehydrogenase family)